MVLYRNYIKDAEHYAILLSRRDGFPLESWRVPDERRMGHARAHPRLHLRIRQSHLSYDRLEGINYIGCTLFLILETFLIFANRIKKYYAQ